MTDPNGAAFPLLVDCVKLHASRAGLTKREYFAAMAMQGHLSNPATTQAVQTLLADTNQDGRVLLGRWSVGDADALIAELNKEPKNET